MQETKKLKIAVVGVGGAGGKVVNLISEVIIHESVKFVKVDYRHDEPNPNATEIEISEIIPYKESVENLLMYFKDSIHRNKLIDAITMMQDGDELYGLKYAHSGCFHFCIGFRLVRDSKTIKQAILKRYW